MMYLIIGEIDKAALPKDLNERKKVWLRMIENVKKDIKAGEVKMVGVNVGGGSSFFVSEQDSKTIFARQAAALVQTNYKIIPMLSLDEAEEVIKGL